MSFLSNGMTDRCTRELQNTTPRIFRWFIRTSAGTPSVEMEDPKEVLDDFQQEKSRRGKKLFVFHEKLRNGTRSHDTGHLH